MVSVCRPPGVTQAAPRRTLISALFGSAAPESGDDGDVVAPPAAGLLGAGCRPAAADFDGAAALRVVDAALSCCAATAPCDGDASAVEHAVSASAHATITARRMTGRS